jgi:putative transposase
MKPMKAFKFKIKRPAKCIVAKFEQHLLLCRELYNSARRERIDAYKTNRISLNYQDQQNQLPEIKEIRDDLKDVYSQVLQDVLKRLDKTFKAFFQRVKKGEKKVGFPHFKGQNRYDSFTFPQATGGFRLDGKTLTLSKIGRVKLHLSQNIIGKVKTCTIKKEVSGWFAIFTVETAQEVLPKTGKIVGIDAGIENLMTLSDGTQIDNYKYFESSQKALRVAQRSVSRKKKGSQSLKKAFIKLKKIHAKIKNQRHDFAHKLSRQIVNKFAVMAIENLNIKKMSQGILSKQIHDVAWYNFFQKLKYKAERAGKQLIKVNPNGTSQTCICGANVKKTLSVRHHHCLKCGLSIHRDIVSAQVILKRAVGQTVGTPTDGISQSVVSESPSLTASV